MKIFIPTYGRAANQTTYHTLPPLIQARTTLVVQAREKHLYDDRYKIAVLPKDIQTISPTRQYIMTRLVGKTYSEKVCMLDDDLLFYTRRKDDPEKFEQATAKDLITMFDMIESALEDYAHVGVLSREGGNRITDYARQCTRMTRILAYDVDTFLDEKIRFNRLPLQEDFDVTLQLLRKGYPNLVLCNWVHNQRTSGDKGGCSHFRTIDLHNANAFKLSELHSPFVKLVQKQTKTAWGGQPRFDVNVQWKKAYQSHKRSVS